MVECHTALSSKVVALMQSPPHRAHVRVPLDISRPQRPRLQWRPLTLSENRVSANVELLDLLGDIRGLKDHTGNVMPLLVDEKVHYTIVRMMVAQPYRQWDMRSWLTDIPLLYGVCAGKISLSQRWALSGRSVCSAL